MKGVELYGQGGARCTLRVSIVKNSNPNVLMMEPTEDRHRDDAADVV
jgi:hypothetical protein